MDKDKIKLRIAELLAQKEQAIANVNALIGAIQDCEYWLAVLEKTGGRRGLDCVGE